MPPQMFLRTALTEQRITDLEEKMALVLERLGMTPKETDEEWEAAAPKGHDGEPGAGEDAPLPEPVRAPITKAKGKAARA